jgi:hypothetical protein
MRSASIHIASRPVRHRLAMAGLALSWSLSVLFFVLGLLAR